jgi:hypothetical protein
MATSKQTIDQVRNILRKLDRDISEARQKRTRTDEPDQAAGPAGLNRSGDQPGAAPGQQPGRNGAAEAQPGEQPEPRPQRARPMRPRTDDSFRAEPRYRPSF